MNREQLDELMRQLHALACPWCHLVTANRPAHESVCLLRPDEDTPDELARLVARERFGRLADRRGEDDEPR